MTQLSLFDEKNDPVFQQDFEKGVKFCIDRDYPEPVKEIKKEKKNSWGFVK